MLWSFALVSLFLSLGRGQECFLDWVYYEGSCYGFGEETLTWPDAQDVCQVYDSTLAEIETSEENDYLKKLASTHGAENYWLGGNDIFHEGVWEWANSKELLSFTDWNPNEPNDNQDHEDCLSMRKLYNYSWNDWPCDHVYNFICESRSIETVVG